MHPATASNLQAGASQDVIPPPLSWAYALVVSRCFAMDDGDTFAFVPFLDMCQHESLPSADFAADTRGFTLTALRDIAENDPVTICYGSDYDSRRLFKQYGFVPLEGNAEDATLLREAVCAASAAGVTGVNDARAEPSLALLGSLGSAFDAVKRTNPLATPSRLGAIYDVLTDGEAPSLGTLHAAVRWRLHKCAPTNLNQDIIDAEQLSPRIRAAVEYRIGWKRQLAVCDEVLSQIRRC